MTTIPHVRACQPDTMLNFSSHLTEKNAIFAERLEQMDRAVDSTTIAWSGNAAAAASARTLSNKLAGSHIGSAVAKIGDQYNTFGTQLAAVRTPLMAIVDTEARGAGMRVDDAGNVTAPKVPSADTSVAANAAQQRLNGQAVALQARIMSLLTHFGDLETSAAQAITADLQQLAGLEKGPDGPPLSTAVQDIVAGRAQLPSDPQQLHDFWAKLTPAERDALFRQDHFIGNRDGIPQVDRDYYNRQNLDYLRADAQAKLDSLLAWGPRHAPTTPAEFQAARERQDKIDALKNQIAGYDKVKGQLPTKDGPPRLLSVIDDRGHAAIALRNPDTAGNVVTYVPGTGATIGKIDDGVMRAEAMQRSAEQLDMSKRTSVVAWYGYDAPQSVAGDATKTSFADNAAAPLDRFQQGLRVTHDGPRATDTIVGHSYGTTVIGHAASGGHTLDADRIVLVGSPGIGVDKAADLSLTGVAAKDVGSHVYSTTAQYDPIRLAPKFIHGPQPVSAPEFGTTFTADPRSGPWYQLGWNSDAHSSYWDNGNPALSNMASIITGIGKVS